MALQQRLSYLPLSNIGVLQWREEHLLGRSQRGLPDGIWRVEWKDVGSKMGKGRKELEKRENVDDKRNQSHLEFRASLEVQIECPRSRRPVSVQCDGRDIPKDWSSDSQALLCSCQDAMSLRRGFLEG